jgi:hypothetical protein
MQNPSQACIFNDRGDLRGSLIFPFPPKHPLLKGVKNSQIAIAVSADFQYQKNEGEDVYWCKCFEIARQITIKLYCIFNKEKGYFYVA